MATLFFDGDKRRIYEVPVNSTYSVDVDGYRIYTPFDPLEEENVVFTNFDLWSRFVDFHFLNEWTTLAFLKSGGAFIETDENGVDQFESFSLRFINDWQFVPANYPHLTRIVGNVRKQFGIDSLFDKSRSTNQTETEVILSDSSQTLVMQGGRSNLSAETIQQIANAILNAEICP